MTAVSLWLPRFATDVARRRLPADPPAIVLSVVDRGREVVAACCAAAARAGVAPGLTLSHARALLPGGVHAEPFDAIRTGRALRRLAAWATRFTPVVALDEPDGLLLDASGCERLYGGRGAIVDRIVSRVRWLGLAARAVVAPTFAAARAVARYGDRDAAVVERPDLAGALANLPVEALGIAPADADALRRVGIERIGRLAALPRAALAARYGDGVLLQLDRAFGRAIEAITPVRVPEPVHAERVFDGPTDRLESILPAARELLERVALDLARRESGCRAVTLRLDRSDLPPTRVRVRTSRPTRDAAHLWSLLRPGIEGAHLGFGVEGLRLEAGGLARLRHEQATRWDDRADAARDADAARLVDALAARLGPESVVRAEPAASYTPERAFRFRPLSSIPDALDEPPAAEARGPATDRPSLLLGRPVPIDAVMLVPDGPIASLRIGGLPRRIASCSAPERIEPEWWRGDRGMRDYFKVRDQDGRWLWVFRDGANGRWFLHGEWA